MIASEGLGVSVWRRPVILIELLRVTDVSCAHLSNS